MNMASLILGGNAILDICERLAVVRSEEAVDIQRQLFKRQVGQSFIESFIVSLAVTQEEVSSGHGCVAQMDAFSCCQSEFGWSPSWWSDPHLASKSSELCPIFLLFGGDFNQTGSVTVRWWGSQPLCHADFV